MRTLPTIDLSAKERLRILNGLERTHPFESLSDTRKCPMCGQEVAGSEIEIVGGTRGYGPLRFQCPICAANGMSEKWLPPQLPATGADSANDEGLVVSHRGKACHCKRRIKNRAGSDRGSSGRRDGLLQAFGTVLKQQLGTARVSVLNFIPFF